jgi:hypothetical protein
VQMQDLVAAAGKLAAQLDGKREARIVVDDHAERHRLSLPRLTDP